MEGMSRIKRPLPSDTYILCKAAKRDNTNAHVGFIPGKSPRLYAGLSIANGQLLKNILSERFDTRLLARC